MTIVFNVFRNISSQIGVEDCERYAFEFLLPLFRVREGFAGKLITGKIYFLCKPFLTPFLFSVFGCVATFKLLVFFFIVVPSRIIKKHLH